MENQTAKPVIRFPEFTDHWNNTKLSELLKEAKKRNADLKYTKDEVLSVSGEMGIVNQIEHLGRSYAGVSVHQYHVVEVGDIVYTKSPLKANPYGIIKQNKKKAGIVSTLYAVYNVKEESAHGEFIEQYFSLDENLNRYLRPLVRKGAKNTLQVSDAEALRGNFLIPSVAEQKKITQLLNILDKKIEQLKQKKSLLEEYKKGIMQKIFAQEIRFKDENENEFPNWETRKLGDICIKVGDGLHGTPIYSDNSDIHFINGNNLTDGKIEITENTKKVDYNTYLKNNKGLNENTLLISINGTIGNIARYNNENIMLGKSVGYFNLQGNIDFFYQVLNSEKIQNYFISELTGSTIKNLSLKTLRETIIPYPCKIEQYKIGNFLATIDDKIRRTQAQTEQTQQYKKGLLQNMFV
jgi:type I restriction enzyme, S subunit